MVLYTTCYILSRYLHTKYSCRAIITKHSYDGRKSRRRWEKSWINPSYKINLPLTVRNVVKKKVFTVSQKRSIDTSIVIEFQLNVCWYAAINWTAITGSIAMSFRNCAARDVIAPPRALINTFQEAPIIYLLIAKLSRWLNTCCARNSMPIALWMTDRAICQLIEPTRVTLEVTVLQGNRSTVCRVRSAVKSAKEKPARWQAVISTPLAPIDNLSRDLPNRVS